MLKMNLSIPAVCFCIVATLLLPGLSWAGDLEPSDQPGPTMKTLDEIPPTWSQILPASERFVLVLNGAAVLDKETGLVWEQSPSTTTRDWASSILYCYQKEVGNRKGWRAATIEELASLIDNDNSNPALPSGHPFVNVPPNHCYSSTSRSVDSIYAIEKMAVDFSSGNVYTTNPVSTLRVWCVRGGSGHNAYETFNSTN